MYTGLPRHFEMEYWENAVTAGSHCICIPPSLMYTLFHCVWYPLYTTTLSCCRLGLQGAAMTGYPHNQLQLGSSLAQLQVQQMMSYSKPKEGECVGSRVCVDMIRVHSVPVCTYFGV